MNCFVLGAWYFDLGFSVLAVTAFSEVASLTSEQRSSTKN